MHPRPSLLIIEDDVDAARLLVRNLTEQGYEVEHGADGHSGMTLALAREWDLIVADRMLPKGDGLTIVEALRSRGRTTPILILSAMSDVDERVRGLRAGGDDYLTKPYALAELHARIESLLRRGMRPSAATRLSSADLELDLVARKAKRSGKEIELTTREFELLTYLMRHEDRIVTRKMLLEHVWDLHFDPQTNVIDVHMSRLRQAIDKGFEPALIHTVRGSGYVFGGRRSNRT